MKPARLIVLGIALLAGGIAAWLASGTRAPEPPKPAPAPPPLATVEVLVAKSDLGVGQVVGDHDVGWQTWPADAANSSFIKKSDRPDAIKDFVGAIVRSPVAGGEPIRDSKVVIAIQVGTGHLSRGSTVVHQSSSVIAATRTFGFPGRDAEVGDRRTGSDRCSDPHPEQALADPLVADQQGGRRTRDPMPGDPARVAWRAQDRVPATPWASGRCPSLGTRGPAELEIEAEIAFRLPFDGRRIECKARLAAQRFTHEEIGERVGRSRSCAPWRKRRRWVWAWCPGP